MNGSKPFWRKLVFLVFMAASVFGIGFFVGVNRSRSAFLRMDTVDRQNLNDGYSLLLQNTTGRVTQAGLCWSTETNGFIRVTVPGTLGRTVLDLSEDGRFLGGRTWEGP